MNEARRMIAVPNACRVLARGIRAESSKRPVTPACPRSHKLHGRTIWSQRPVSRQERRAFLAGLGNQNAIERIGMVQREVGNLQRVARRDRQLPQPFFASPARRATGSTWKSGRPSPALVTTSQMLAAEKWGCCPSSASRARAVWLNRSGA